MSGASITAEPPPRAAPPEPAGRAGPATGRGRSSSCRPSSCSGAWLVYPTIYTIVRSFFGPTGYLGTWVGIDNYRTLFTTSTLVTAIKNSAIWVAVVPAFVCAFGLLFAVLTERIRWSVAFKTVIFLPMAISAFATGVTWRLMYQQNPDQGAINALGRTVSDAVTAPGVLSNALPSTTALQSAGRRPGPEDAAPPGRRRPARPHRYRAGGHAAGSAAGGEAEREQSGAIEGVVWRDFKPGGGKPGVVEQGELGLPGVTVELKDSSGKVVQSAKTDPDGSFEFTGLSPGTYNAGIGAATFAKPFGGYSWLGPKLITPALLIAYIWIWAGFSMVVIAAGLAAMSREVLEAARTDGATEWQVFRRVTVPLLAPVLSVVFITMIINVLKVFDIVIALAPESTQANASVIALAMWRTSFSGFDFGTGSAIAVFLFLLVLPVLALNIRRFRREA